MIREALPRIGMVGRVETCTGAVTTQQTNLKIVEKAGFEIVESAVVQDDEDGGKVPFLWVLARKKRGRSVEEAMCEIQSTAATGATLPLPLSRSNDLHNLTRPSLGE